jgi:hypothetical protein
MEHHLINGSQIKMTIMSGAFFGLVGKASPEKSSPDPAMIHGCKVYAPKMGKSNLIRTIFL